MAQYYWTAEDYNTGDNPTEWTAQANCSIAIEEDSQGRKYLDVTAPNSTRSTLSFDPPGEAENCEVWARFRGSSNSDMGAAMRATTWANPGNADVTRTDYIADTGNDRLSEYRDGGFWDLTEQPLTTPADTIGQLRGNVTNDQFQGRWWDDGATEPDTWGLSATSGVTGTGVFGWVHWKGDDTRIYEYGAGTAGDPAPTAPLSTATTATATGQTTAAGGRGSGVTTARTAHAGGQALSSGASGGSATTTRRATATGQSLSERGTAATAETATTAVGTGQALTLGGTGARSPATSQPVTTRADRITATMAWTAEPTTTSTAWTAEPTTATTTWDAAEIQSTLAWDAATIAATTAWEADRLTTTAVWDAATITGTVAWDTDPVTATVVWASEQVIADVHRD